MGSATVAPPGNNAKEIEDTPMSTPDIESLDEARKLVRDLRQKTRAQAQQIVAWRRAYKMQVNNVIKTEIERNQFIFFRKC